MATYTIILRLCSATPMSVTMLLAAEINFFWYWLNCTVNGWERACVCVCACVSNSPSRISPSCLDDLPHQSRFLDSCQALLAQYGIHFGSESSADCNRSCCARWHETCSFPRATSSRQCAGCSARCWSQYHTKDLAGTTYCTAPESWGLEHSSLCQAATRSQLSGWHCCSVPERTREDLARLSTRTHARTHAHTHSRAFCWPSLAA